MFVFVVVLGIMNHGAPLMVRVCQVTTITTQEGEISLRLGDWGIHTSVTCALQLIQTRYIGIHISVSSTLQFIKKINSIDEEVEKIKQEANLDNVLYITKL